MILTIKIGSNVLAKGGGVLDVALMERLVSQIASLHACGHKIILVSSGAMAAGRSMTSDYEHLEPVARRQLLSSIGQVKLIDQYKQIFDHHNIKIGQILVTKQDFRTREHYLNIRNCISILWNNSILPIVNENDPVSLDGLMFTDNDELSGLLASMMNADKLFILSNIDGIFDGDPKAEETKVIREISPKMNVSQYVQTTKSGFGRGGMQTKCRTAQKVASSGIDVYIANGTTDNVLVRLIDNDPTLLSTHFLSGKPSTAIKKWIASSDGFATATVVVNQRAKDVLLGDKASSLLTAGIIKYVGEFKKNDILLIKDENDQTIGVGRAGMDISTAKKQTTANSQCELPVNSNSSKIPKKTHSKPLIHYDYLYIY